MMTEQTQSCLKCQGKMEQGMLADEINRGMSLSQAFWIRGCDKERAFWSGSLKVEDQDLLTVSGWRCSNCGYLELYANPESE